MNAAVTGKQPAPAWNTLRLALERRRESIQNEIVSYRSPIPACDVDFNDLLNERGLVTDELRRLDTAQSASAAQGDDDAALRRYVASIPDVIRRLVPALSADGTPRAASAPADA